MNNNKKAKSNHNVEGVASLFDASSINNNIAHEEISQDNTYLKQKKKCCNSVFFCCSGFRKLEKSSIKSANYNKKPSNENENINNNRDEAAVDSLLYQLKIEKKMSRRDLLKRRSAATEIITPYSAGKRGGGGGGGGGGRQRKQQKKQRGNVGAIHNLIISRRRVVKLIITLVALFLFSWLPYYFISLTIDILLYCEQIFNYSSSSNSQSLSSAILQPSNKIKQNDDTSENSTVITKSQFVSIYIYPIALCLALANSATNPVCYIALSPGFKNMFKNILQRE